MMILAQTPSLPPPLVADTVADAIELSSNPVAEQPEGFSVDYILNNLKEAFIEIADGAISALPHLIIGAVLLFVGIIVAKVFSAVLTTTFKKIKLDELFVKMGLSEILAKIGLKSGPTAIIPKILYWLILVLFVKAAADKAGIEQISALLEQIMAFLPRVLTSGIILLIGFIVADLIRNAAFRSLDDIGLEYAGSLSRILFGFIFVLILTVSFSQLGIETELLNASVKIILGGLSLALALALGLGLKNLTSHIVSGVYARDLYKIGTEIHYEDLPAKVTGVGPLTTKLTRDDGSFLIIPNSILINEIVRGRTEN